MANRVIFWSLTAIFLAYSSYVWTVGTAAPQSKLATTEVRRGHTLYQENNCTACHQIYGLGGYMGPDLTNVVSSKGHAYAGAFLANGTASMPNFGFTPAEINDLVSFLDFVDSMGVYESTHYQVRWNGTVAQAAH